MLDAIIAEQKRQGLSDGVFALSLGVARQTWNHTVHGRRLLSPKIVRAAIRLYPHLMQDGVFFLLSDSTESKVALTSRKQPSNIDLAQTEDRGELVLVEDAQTVACRGEPTDPTGQGGSVGGTHRAGARMARKVYVTPSAIASERSSRAVSRVGEAG